MNCQHPVPAPTRISASPSFSYISDYRSVSRHFHLSHSLSPTLPSLFTNALHSFSLTGRISSRSAQELKTAVSFFFHLLLPTQSLLNHRTERAVLIDSLGLVPPVLHYPPLLLNIFKASSSFLFSISVARLRSV